jgi:hypothetical protein
VRWYADDWKQQVVDKVAIKEIQELVQGTLQNLRRWRHKRVRLYQYRMTGERQLHCIRAIINHEAVRDALGAMNKLEVDLL